MKIFHRTLRSTILLASVSLLSANLMAREGVFNRTEAFEASGISIERVMLGYIDPGFGALIWQAMVATFFAALFYFRKTLRLLCLRGKAPKDPIKAVGENPLPAKREPGTERNEDSAVPP
jgi:hypothetical protein